MISLNYKELYDNAPCGYLYVNEKGLIQEVNQKFCEFTLYSKNEVLDKRFTDFLSLAGKIYFDTTFSPILRLQGKLDEINFDLKKKDGKKRPVLVNAIEVNDHNGDLTYTQYTLFDISQRKKYEVQLLESKKESEKLSLLLSQKNEKLTKQKALLDDSINYSEKIQYSILPSRQKLKEQFDEVFAFYQPKDTIGGDFYWCHKDENYSYVAVIDCTGHGVPGALMSMAVNAFLNEIVKANRHSNPAEVLELLHIKVHETFQQEQGNQYSQDGCDIAFCTIDKKKNRFHYSGANIDLFLCDNNKLSILKSTPKSVGGVSLLGEFEYHRNFKTIDLEINENTMLILTTDGLLDQLNEHDEAFYNKQFTILSKELSISPNEKREEITNIAINNWMKDTDQLDDIQVIGLKIKQLNKGVSK